MSTLQILFPRWKCHKEVQAFKIAAIEPEKMPTFIGATCRGSFALGSACGNCERCKWERTHGPEMTTVLIAADDGPRPRMTAVRADYMTKHKPEVGGYFVLYADGYQSYSPAKAFEEGYTRIP